MRQQALRHTRLADPIADSDSRRTRDAVNDIKRSPLVDGQFAKTGSTSSSEIITLANAAVNKLKHGLGRPLKGWLVCDLTSTGDIAAVGSIHRVTSGADDKEDIWLKPIGFSGLDLKVRVWVF